MTQTEDKEQSHPTLQSPAIFESHYKENNSHDFPIIPPQLHILDPPYTKRKKLNNDFKKLSLVLDMPTVLYI